MSWLRLAFQHLAQFFGNEWFHNWFLTIKKDTLKEEKTLKIYDLQQLCN